MSRGEKLGAIFDSIAAAGFDLAGMRGTIIGALEDAVEVGLCENGHKVHKERRAAGKLADAVGRYIDGGRNDEEGLCAALSRWVESGDVECVPQVGTAPNASLDALISEHRRMGLYGEAPQVPEGWKLVPVAPTQAMLDAGYYPATQGRGCKSVWQTMLDAAPSRTVAGTKQGGGDA